MSKYIDLNEATDLFKGIDATMTGGWVADTLEALPTIDIVHCGDCKWYRDFDGCFFSTAECEPEHFCSWGERSEE